MNIVNGGNPYLASVSEVFSEKYRVVRTSDSSSNLIYRRLLSGNDFFIEESPDSFEFIYLVIREIGKKESEEPFILVTKYPLENGFVNDDDEEEGKRHYPPGFFAIKLISRYDVESHLYTENERGGWIILLSVSTPLNVECYDPLVYRAATFLEARTVMRERLSVIPVLRKDVTCCLYLDDDRLVCYILGIDYVTFRKLKGKMYMNPDRKVIDLYDELNVNISPTTYFDGDDFTLASHNELLMTTDTFSYDDVFDFEPSSSSSSSPPYPQPPPPPSPEAESISYEMEPLKLYYDSGEEESDDDNDNTYLNRSEVDDDNVATSSEVEEEGEISEDDDTYVAKSDDEMFEWDDDFTD